MRKMILYMSLALLSTFTFIRCDDDDTLAPTETAKFKIFSDAMRELWTDHVVYTRNAIIDVFSDAASTNQTVARLLQNQVDIGNAIKPYYGNAAGDTLTALLKEHINTAAALLIAAKNNNTTDFNTAKTAWYVNADEIAAFLHNANPDNFGLQSWKDMMKDHLDLTLQEAVAQLSGDYSTSISTFDQIYDQALMMADMLAEGIALQFPDEFD